MNLAESFSQIRQLCLRATMAPPDEAIGYLEFIERMATQATALLKAQLADQPDLLIKLGELENDLLVVKTMIIELTAALRDRIDEEREPNLQ